jgi:hypothetical protein
MKNLWLAGVPALLLTLSGAAHAQGQLTSTAFNPAISLILDGNFTSYSLDPETYGIDGFLLGPEAGLKLEGLSADETELSLSSNVDDKFYGFATVSLGQNTGGETDVSVEEAWFETLALPYGLTVKAGKFFSDVGYINATHPHAWDFVDAPLAYLAMLGGTYADSGVEVRWVAPTILYVELGAELMRGAGFPASGAANGGHGASTVSAHVGGDVGASNSWRAGVSYISANARDREAAVEGGLTSFTGDSNVTILDFVWKWAENGNPRQRNFIAQAEYLRRSESGALSFVNPFGFTADGNYDGDQDGFYAQAVYQWRQRWRVGARYDRLSASNTVTGLPVATPLDSDHNPNRISAMVDFSNSEFTRLRLQLSRDESRPQSDRQIFLQYIMSMGTHGAHRF